MNGKMSQSARCRGVLRLRGQCSSKPGMIQRLLVPLPARFDAGLLRTELPSVDVVDRASCTPRVRVTAEEWETGAPDFVALDLALGDAGGERPVSVLLEGRGDVTNAALAVLTRLQWALPLRDSSPMLGRLRRRHRELHDLRLPLVHADWLHALDTQQWAARLDRHAGPAVLIAALFHDVERLVDETRTRLDHLAADYDAFKRAHARRGARLARSVLERELPAPMLERVLFLIERHEAPGDDRDLQLVNDADALSFFSRNAGGFLSWYGEEQTRRKVAWTAARLSPQARTRLETVRVPESIAAMLSERGDG